MELHNIRNNAKGMTTWGCMWKQGECPADEQGKAQRFFVCKNEQGKWQPMQSRITAYWPDGSVKWSAHTAEASGLGSHITVELSEQDMCIVSAQALQLQETQEDIRIQNGAMQMVIDKNGNSLIASCTVNGVPRFQNVRPVLQLEEPFLYQGESAKTIHSFLGRMEQITIEESGDLQTVIKYEGTHVSKDGQCRFPFIIRMTVNAGWQDVGFSHTFLYDGEEDKDYLKGIGISMEVPLAGALYNRHIKFTGDYGVFHEECVALRAWRPKIPPQLYASQAAGELLTLSGEEAKLAQRVLDATPYWSTYELCQDSDRHFAIRKKIADENCCMIDCLHGGRCEGGAAIGSESGSILFGIRDFWQKYPTGYEIKGLDTDMAQVSLWFYSPAAHAFDFRHYANRGYNQVCYEGYDYKGADPDGIACTSECMLRLSDALIPADEELIDFCHSVDKPALYVGTPQFYHDMRAFGYWSLPSRENEMEEWLETQLERAADFYLQEVEQRGWYGMFNYGDFMHSYDSERHQWRYDMGGYAWDNTELVPTLWLWLYFLRTGREDVFTLAEKLSRHACDVDVYHFGKYKGLGSRHNVRHWGCPCKEARIAMAAHHRVLYYLTGERRLRDIFEELKDNEDSFFNKDPLGDFYEKKDMVYPSHARSGPDWSSLCSNWMTWWEMTRDEKYRDKILTGLDDIRRAPLRLVSGPDFEFDPHTCHLRYIGERTTGGSHLQVCMGAPQVWLELADWLDDADFKQMLAELGRFYYLPREQQLEESGGIIGEREFTLPFMCAALGAYGASYLQEDWLAARTWQILLETLIHDGNHDGFAAQTLDNCGNCRQLREIPWISTNFAAQWCLNVIMVLEYIRKSLPRTMGEAEKLTADGADFLFRKA